MHHPTPPTAPPPDTTSGGVPNAWGNALALRWAPQLPAECTGGMLRLLYGLRTLAAADGALCWARDRRPFSAREIAGAIRADIKDTRVWLSASLAAGVLAADARPGCATLYRLVVHPRPDWGAAEAVIRAARDRRTATRARRAATRDTATAPAPWTAPEPEATRSHPDTAPGGTVPPSTEGDGPPTPLSTTSGDGPPTHPGGRSPQGVGGRSPHQPMTTQVIPQEMAAVEPQPQESPPDAGTHHGPQLHAVPDAPPAPVGSRARRRAAEPPPGQRPLLLAVPGQQPDPAAVRAVIATEGAGAARAQFGLRALAAALATG